MTTTTSSTQTLQLESLRAAIQEEYRLVALEPQRGFHFHTGRRLVTFPHGEYVPVSGNGARLLFNGFSRIYAVEPRRSR